MPTPQPISSSLLGDVLARQAVQYPDKDALIYPELGLRWSFRQLEDLAQNCARGLAQFCAKSSKDRKSTRLNSSHVAISYAVFCLKKKLLQDGYTTFVAMSTHLLLVL